MDVVLGIDLGTSNFKAALYTKDGSNIGIGRVSVNPTLDNGIRYELSVEKFVSTLAECINLALIESKCSIDDIKGVSYSSQANSFLLLDKNNNTLTPLIIWSDQRAEAAGSEFQNFADRADLLTTTGMGLYSSSAAAAKLLWFREHQPEIWDRTAHIMTISDYLSFLLTGRRVGDSGTASLTGLWSLKDNSWWKSAFNQLKLKPEMFSECLRPGTIIGEICESAAHEFPLPKGIPFAVGGLDHHMAALGSGIGTYADYSESTGTVLAFCSLLPLYDPIQNCAMGPGLGTERPYYRLSFQEEGGVILKKYRQKYTEGLNFKELDKQADNEPPGSRGIFALIKPQPFSINNNFYGNNPSSTTGQYVRAIMEAVTASLKDLAYSSAGIGRPERILATGGGAQSDIWLQIKADMLGMVIVAVEGMEPACTGAAMFAACAAGWAMSPESLSSTWIKVRKEFYPDKDNNKYYQDWYERYQKAAAIQQ